jgi:hypothetical protein
MKTFRRRTWGNLALCAFTMMCVSVLSVSANAAAKPRLQVASAVWSPKNGGKLTVKGKLIRGESNAVISLASIDGKTLGGAVTDKNFSIVIPGSALAVPDNLSSTGAGYAVPCAVRVSSGSLSAAKKVAGNPNKACRQQPTCSIVATTPAYLAGLKLGDEVTFTAKASFPGRRAEPKYEWDFGGAAMGEDITGQSPVTVHKKPDGKSATVKFVRDGARYRVRFSAVDNSLAAMESKQYRCEDSLEVVVGTTPVGLPSAVSEETAPAVGSELNGDLDDYVVMPFEDWTMQSDTDANFMPDLYSSTSPSVHNLKAVVYKKALKPPVVDAGEIQLAYSAASNPNDPAGKGSINSTSQNWPLNAMDIQIFSPMMGAAVQKSQLWEKFTERAENMKSATYKRHFWAAFGSNYPFSPLPESARPYPDEGFIIGIGGQDDPNVKGSFMPGKAAPYTANDPQSFGPYNSDEKVHEVKMLPLSDVDDRNRINPYPLFRVQAKAGNEVKAATDVALSSGRDFHCRGCHAKGKIAAKSNAYTAEAFASSPTGMKNRSNYTQPYPSKPTFYDVTEFNGDPENIHDQERAASLNFASLHDFYDGLTMARFALYGGKSDMLSSTIETDPVNVDGPVQCTGCHATPLRYVNFNVGPDVWWDGMDHDPTSMDYDPNYTISLHRFHGELQWNPDKTDIKRLASGIYERWDWKTKGSNNKNDTSLFPIFDKATGKQMPMEENCLKCHEGERESHYRDRMATAGVTCYDCHGDMLAVGEAFPRKYLENGAKLGSMDLRDYRLAWFDNPDCGSCHTGDANVGGDKTNGYFSAGVKQRAFEDNDPSATTRPVDRANPTSTRFSAAPLKNYQMNFTTSLMTMDPNTHEFIYTDVPMSFDAPLYRFGRDAHGDVPCAACHGAAHAIWPNRDPNANDNLTSLQLQGHTGTILECNVCHTSDSFAKMADLDSGLKTGLAENNFVLGGPHNTHPINDPYWWKSAPTDEVANADGTKFGGWHNDYAKKPGQKGEDQCAACHGKDHKGTRLSRTPVDRVFDFSDLDKFDFKKLTKVGFKKKVIKVPAGSVIGCDTCHNLPTSFICSPSTTPAPKTPACSSD